MRLLVVFLLLSLFSFSCRSGLVHKREAVAKAGDAYLYMDELKKAIPEGLSPEDSLFRTENFIRSWIKEQLLFQKAMQSLSKAEKDKDEELDKYYRSLISHAYEEKMAGQNMDTLLSSRDVESYYRQNLRNFELKRNIIRLLYVKLPLETQGIDKARRWVRDFNYTGLDSLRQYAEEYASNKVLDTSSWFYFDDIAKEIPIEQTYSYGHFVRNNTFVELKDSANIYLINIVDRRIKDDIAPLPLVRDRIKNILKHQRQVEFLQKLENNIYEEAQQEQGFEIYTK